MIHFYSQIHLVILLYIALQVPTAISHCALLTFQLLVGGGHFALYLNSDLLSGSSSVSETYGNPCLANSEDFDVKEVELWGFVSSTKYEEVLAQSCMEAPGICQW